LKIKTAQLKAGEQYVIGWKNRQNVQRKASGLTLRWSHCCNIAFLFC